MWIWSLPPVLKAGSSGNQKIQNSIFLKEIKDNTKIDDNQSLKNGRYKLISALGKNSFGRVAFKVEDKHQQDKRKRM